MPNLQCNMCPACAQTAAPERVPRLLPPRSEALRGLPLPAPAQRQLAAMEAAVGCCDLSPDAPLVVYVSKMVAVPASALPRLGCLGFDISFLVFTASHCGPPGRANYLPPDAGSRPSLAEGSRSATTRSLGLRVMLHLCSACINNRPVLQLPATLTPSPLHFQVSDSDTNLPACHCSVCRRHGQPTPANPHAETFLAFGRVFSGVIREGATVQVCIAVQLGRIDSYSCDAHGNHKSRQRSLWHCTGAVGGLLARAAGAAAAGGPRLRAVPHDGPRPGAAAGTRNNSCIDWLGNKGPVLQPCSQYMIWLQHLMNPPRINPHWFASKYMCTAWSHLVICLLQEVPAGNVLAIGGLDTAILKSATLTDSPTARPLAPMLFQVSECAGCSGQLADHLTNTESHISRHTAASRVSCSGVRARKL